MKKTLFWIIGCAALLTMGQGMAAKKPSIGVAEFKNQTHAGWWRGGVGWELAGMVTNELAGTGNFRVVERSKLEHVLREQDLGATGRVRKGTAAKLGKLTGAKYLVMGTLTAFEQSSQGTGGGLSFGGISIGGKQEKAYMAVDLRVVDTTSGEIAFSRTVEANSSSSGFNLGLYKGGFGGKLAQHKKTPVGKAIRAVIMEITDYLGCVMVEKDDCMDAFAEKERSRRERTKGAIELE